MSASASDNIVAPEIPRLQPEDVAKSLSRPGVVILDVRDGKEVDEGRIKGSVNVPSAVFKSEDTTALDEVIQDQLSGAQEVVVHCVFSKIRGPTCAKALSERLKALGLNDGIEVKVLAGGAATFLERYRDDPSLVELPEEGWKPPAAH